MRAPRSRPLGVWFPTIQAGTGADVFTRRLCEGLHAKGIRAKITWLPHRAEYAPLTVAAHPAPDWATVVHVNTWMHPSFLPDALPVVATLHHSVHDPALRQSKGALRDLYHRHWIASVERRVMRRSQSVVAVSRFVAEMARESLCDVPIDVVYNGVDTSNFTPGVSVRDPAQPFRLLYVGSWIPRKGVDLLPHIMRELGDGFELHYTGGADAELDKARMPKNTLDLGKLDERRVAECMRSADALILPTRSEGFGLVAAEAMAAGLPVIATKVSSLPEIVSDGVSGFLCERDDVMAFAAAARTLARMPAIAATMSRAAVQQARELFPIELMVDRYIEVYSRLAPAP